MPTRCGSSVHSLLPHPCTALASASPHRPPATSTSAARAPRCSTGSSPGRPAAPSSCASRTPTRSAAPRRTPGSSSTGSSWLGLDLGRGPVLPGRRTATAPPGRRRAPAGGGTGVSVLLHAGGARTRSGARPRPPARRSATTGRCDRLTPRTMDARRVGRGHAVRRSASACPTARSPGTTRCTAGSAFQGRDLDDFIILRSDGTPIYNLAVVSRRHRDAHHPRDARRRPRLQHAEADPAVPRRWARRCRCSRTCR